MIVAVTLGSICSYVKIRQAREISANVVNARVPLLDAIRNMRQNSFRSTSALKSYLLFGLDPEAAQRYKKERAAAGRRWTGCALISATSSLLCGMNECE